MGGARQEPRSWVIGSGIAYVADCRSAHWVRPSAAVRRLPLKLGQRPGVAFEAVTASRWERLAGRR